MGCLPFNRKVTTFCNSCQQPANIFLTQIFKILRSGIEECASADARRAWGWVAGYTEPLRRRVPGYRNCRGVSDKTPCFIVVYMEQGVLPDTFVHAHHIRGHCV